ncbi:MAG: hypothetical protein V1859_11585 [archaeon]
MINNIIARYCQSYDDSLVPVAHAFYNLGNLCDKLEKDYPYFGLYAIEIVSFVYSALSSLPSDYNTSINLFMPGSFIPSETIPNSYCYKIDAQTTSPEEEVNHTAIEIYYERRVSETELTQLIAACCEATTLVLDELDTNLSHEHLSVFIEYALRLGANSISLEDAIKERFQRIQQVAYNIN